MVVKTEPKAATKPQPKAKPPAGDHLTHHAPDGANHMRMLTVVDTAQLRRALDGWGIELMPGVNLITVRITMPGAPKKAAKRGN